jgi:hypothetical protein
MRFAWLRKNSANSEAAKQESGQTFSLIRLAYNIIFWSFLIPFFTPIDYGTGFIIFTVIILIRLSANLYINFLDFQPEQYEEYPLRS